MQGTNGADQRCRDAAIGSRKLRGKTWRAVIGSKWRSLQSLLIYETERRNASVVNINGELLYSSWLDFLSGIERSENPILTFSGADLESSSQ